VEKGLAPTREKAQALVLAGQVLVNGAPAPKPGALVDEAASLQVKQSLAFVSRGGTKLDDALNRFRLDVVHMVALDVGASTGGFTDCLLQRGAAKVYALDVGYGQLDLKLRRDPRVVVMERVNAHYPFLLPEPVSLATVDVSFISVRKVIPNILAWIKEPAWLIVLVKPQFEAPRSQVKKGGIVKDPLVHAQVLGSVANWAIHSGLRVAGLVPSPILGTEGNREFFLLLRRSL